MSKHIGKRIDERGFTLTELLVVVAVIGILVAIAVPSYLGHQKRAARSEASSNLQALRLLEEQFFAENAGYTVAATCSHATILPDGTCFAPAVLPGFKPGTGRIFDYAIIPDVALSVPVAVPFGGATAAQTPCFVATATGVAGTRVAGDVFAIDCNNNRNF